MLNKWMMRNIWIDLRDFFFPRLCLGCGKKLRVSEHGLCLRCMMDLPKTHYWNTKGNEMEKCMWANPQLLRASALYFYTKGGTLSKVLRGMKYQHRKSLCVQMGRLIATELYHSGFFVGVDCLIPVPLHPARFRQRGYNQSEMMARGIAEITGIPLVSDALIRIHNNATQTHKSSIERWQNAQGLFVSTPKAEMLKNKHVLLVDDVFTTGATLSACIAALSSVESIQASIVTLAYAK